MAVQYSPDGKYWWDGQRWVPVGTGSAQAPFQPILNPAPGQPKSRRNIVAGISGAAALLTAVAAIIGAMNGIFPHSSSPPSFEVVSTEASGQCTVSGGCPVSATFRNTGGAGSGAAVLSIVDNTTGETYGSCTGTIPRTENNGVSKASCTIFSPQISEYLATQPYGQPVTIPAHVVAEAKNPGG